MNCNGILPKSKNCNGKNLKNPKENEREGGGFYMYTIIKRGPDIHTTKKFGDIFISSRFFILTSVSFRPLSVSN